MARTVNREIRLAARPVGWPKASDFELAEAPLPEPAAGVPGRYDCVAAGGEG